MCGPAAVVPAWVAYASLAATVASTAMTAYGMYQQGQTAKKNADYQAAIENNKAIAARYQADDIRKRGDEAADAHRDKVQQLLGRQKAVMSANGIDIAASDTALDVLGDTAQYGELDALTIRNNAEREAWGVEIQATNADAEAGLMRARGAQAAASGMFGAGTSLLSGAASFGEKWYTFDKAGAFK